LGLNNNERADRKDEIEEMLKSINENIGEKRSDEEVAIELGDEQFPRAENSGDWNDAFENDKVEENDFRRSDADDYTPEAFDQYLSAEIVADRGGDLLRKAYWFVQPESSPQHARVPRVFRRWNGVDVYREFDC
jgi:hypothetical protein